MFSELSFKRHSTSYDIKTFHLNRESSFDKAIDGIIKKIEGEIDQIEKEYYGIIDLENSNPKAYAELLENTACYDTTLADSQRDLFFDIMYNKDQLVSFCEMKVVNAFKSLEINIKLLLSIAFEPKSMDDFYKWENIKQYLKERNIDITKFTSYQNVFDLKTVNNKIKHSLQYETALQQIPEFKDNNEFTYKKIDQFYNRVCKSPIEFIKELAVAVYNELYTFDDDKIDTIAKALVVRMEKEDAVKLISKLNEYYDYE